MQQEIDIPREPLTHKLNTPYGPCFDSSNALNKQEIMEWNQLRLEVQPLFDVQEQNCIKRIKGLWYILVGTDLPDDQIKNQKWTEFGFQAANPTTDFRGGGIQSLDDIISFAQNHKDVVQKMCDPTNDYFFAASSINVTFFLKKYFHLLENLHPKKDREEFCSRLALKNFCHFLVKEENLWQQLHSMLLIDLFCNCWLGLRKERENVTIMDYGLAFDRMKTKVKRAFSNRKYNEFQQLVNYYKSQN